LRQRSAGSRDSRIGKIVAAVVLVGLAGACASSSGGVNAAHARVSNAEKAVSEAQAALHSASAKFCADAKDYITALDRYGKVFTDAKATVGDVKTAGADLEHPRTTVTASADGVAAARDQLAKANKELTDARAALATAQAAASSVTLPPTTATSTTSTTAPVSTATVDRVKKAESDLAAAFQGITDQTPLAQATTKVNSAAFALEVAWLQLFNEAGCLTAEQQQKAAAAVHDYTVAVQTDLRTAGYYTGEVDGVYGPAVTEAVKKLQTANGLPATGWVDRATAAALDAAVLAKGGAAASRAMAETAAVQTTLKLAGYWTGPIDGHWTPELTDALKKFQTALGVPPTGEVDAATLDALEQAIANAKESAPTTVPPGETTTSSSTTTATTG
jgi:peptidoglycan hydrolase-like protein with peptidoglycan-binding domain